MPNDMDIASETVRLSRALAIWYGGTMRVLCIEDEAIVAEFVKTGLSGAGFTVDVATSAEEGASAFESVEYDAVILDLGLPDADGISLLRKLRGKREATPVIILSTRSNLNSRVGGLNAGADDYLPKPFAIEELTARLHALLRRPRTMLSPVLACGNVAYSPATHEVKVAGRSVAMAPKEMRVLDMLLRRPGTVISKQQLESWLYGFEEEVASNAVEVHIHHLRRRLAESKATVKITTQRGVGYVLIGPDA